MTEQEQREMKAENARFLQQKADAEAAWHKELRDTLKIHSAKLVEIEHNTSELPTIRSELRGLEIRVKCIEDFKLKAVAGMSTAFALLAALWKLIDKLWQ